MEKNEIKNENGPIAVVGTGYVGLPLAIGFSKKVPAIGFDVVKEKIELLRNGVDTSGEFTPEALKSAAVEYTDDPARLDAATVFIVAVPTPVHDDKTLDLAPLIGASNTIGEHLSPGGLVVYESTVYPGVTEDVCIPILEKKSGMKAGRDFWVGYSPERINPGDREHTLTSTVKIISGQDETALEKVEKVYGLLFDGSVPGSLYKARSIKVAEAAKIVENTQRDINIAFMNEIAQILHRIGVDTVDVLNAMNTKWNALGFRPGLVGGHCISVDPYYLIQEAERMNYHANFLSAARAVNEDIPVMIAQQVIRAFTTAGKNPAGQRVYALGLTFKGNVRDMRNAKMKRIVDILASYGVDVKIADPMAVPGDIARVYGREPVAMEDVRDGDCLIIGADHRAFHSWTDADFSRMLRPDGAKLIFDICNIYDRASIEGQGYRYWSL